ncbi:MAG: hypothetical protein JXR76_08800 [Deltaproteobacteria bacterium]|nr:hypothetical protein [Deltaproteobacteria bacterium]
MNREKCLVYWVVILLIVAGAVGCSGTDTDNQSKDSENEGDSSATDGDSDSDSDSDADSDTGADGDTDGDTDADGDTDMDGDTDTDGDTDSDGDSDADTDTGGNGDGCKAGAFPTADPSVPGPFETVTELEVGPQAGVGDEGEDAPRFTMFRPADMSESGLCHPVITWGNGTGANPSMYKALLQNLASHGFVVIGSDSPNVAQGDPPPMIAGVTWVLEQNDDPSSELYQRIDTANIGATGHSQGAMATSRASTDEHITTNVPIEGAMRQNKLHGPAMFFCGGKDDVVGCSGAEGALEAMKDFPAMYAEHLESDHGSWMTFMGKNPSPVETAIIAWMRVHLMNDTELRSWFYGSSCKLCEDSDWKIIQKNMDE